MTSDIPTPTPRETLEAAIASLGLRISSVFVPWSQSRGKAEKYRSLNWKVTVHRGDREILTCDYSAGTGHCPASHRPPKLQSGSIDRWAKDRLIQFECECGFAGRMRFGGDHPTLAGPPVAITPDPCDVLYSLSLDASVLDYATFEDWASDFGADPDSRSAEATYRACLDIALKLRAGIGDEGLNRLREAAQDY